MPYLSISSRRIEGFGPCRNQRRWPALAVLTATFACLSPAATPEGAVTTHPTMSTEDPPTSSLIHLYVPDCDAVYAQAMAAGATSVAEPADQFYSDRLARITDPHNNCKRWS